MPGENRARKLQQALFTAAGTVALVSSVARAQSVHTWNGGGSDNSWSNAANWTGGAPDGNDEIHFAGSTQLNPFNDFASYNGYRIFFDSGAGAFTLTGNGITLFDFGSNAPKIENSSTSLQTISIPITLDGSATAGSAGEINPVLGDLLFTSTVTLNDSGNTQLRIFGNTGKTVTFNGIISGSNSVVIRDNNNVVYGAANTYTGATFVNAGALRFAAGGSTSTNLNVGDNAIANSPAATISFDSVTGGQSNASIIQVRPSASGTVGTRTVKSTNTSGTNTLSGQWILDADVTVSADNAGGTLALTGTSINLKNQTMTVTGSGNTNISALIEQSTGSGKLVKNGSGVLTLSTANTSTGSTTINGGVVSISTDTNLGTAPGIATAGHLSLNGGTIRHNATGAVTFLAGNRGVAIGATGGTIDIPSSAAILIYTNGQITGSGNTLTKSGAGILRVATPSAITFSKLVVTGGAYQGGADTHYGAVPGSFLPDAITLDGGGLGVTTGINLVANRGVTLGPGGGVFSHTSNLGVLGVISGTQGGGIVKQGTGILTLAAINTYDGTTQLDAGVASLSASTSTLGNGVGALILNGGSLSAGANKIGASAIPNPITLQGSSTVAASVTRSIEFSSNSVTTTSGQLTIASTGTGTTSLRMSGAGFDFSRPLVFSSTGGGTAELALWNSTGQQTFSGIISGNGFVRRSITSGSAGTTIFSGANTYTGNTTLNEGTMGFGVSTVPSSGAITSGPIGTGNLVFNAGAIGVFAADAARVVRNPVTVNRDFFVVGANDLELGGAMALGTTTRLINVTNSGATLFSGVISGSASVGLTKSGTGVLTLSGANTYSGTTTVSQGVLRVNNTTGSGLGSGAVVVTSAGTIGGNGSFTGALTLAGTVAPGNSVGQLTTGAEEWQGGGSYAWEISDANDGPGAGWDHIQMSTLTISATPGSKFIIALNSNGVAPNDFVNPPPHPPGNYEWTIATASGGITGFDPGKFQIDASNFVGVAPGGHFKLQLFNSDTQLRIVYVPEPGAAMLALLGALASLRRRHR